MDVANSDIGCALVVRRAWRRMRAGKTPFAAIETDAPSECNLNPLHHEIVRPQGTFLSMDV